jgi:hypothetical protein
VSYQSGIGPTGSTPERTAEYGFVGFTMSGRWPSWALRVRERRGDAGQPALARPIGCFRHGGYGGERRAGNFVAARDVIVDRNQIAHSPVGIELDRQCRRGRW